MKNLITTLFFSFCGLVSFAQATTGTTVFGKVAQSSVIYELPFSEAVVLDALEKKMSTYNAQVKKVKGFYVYRSVVIPEISSRPINLYFNIDKKGRKGNTASTLSMLIADDKDLFLESVSEPDLFNRAKEFVNTFNSDVNVSQNNFDVVAQEKEIDKIAKKIKNLENDQEDLKKKIKKMEEQLSKNEKDLKDEMDNLEAQKKLLENLKNKN